MGGTLVGNCEFSYHSGQMSFGFSAKGHLLCKTTIIKITGVSRGPRDPPTRTSEWVRVSETHPQVIRVGKALRDPSQKLLEWASLSGIHHQGPQKKKGTGNPDPTFLSDRKR